MFNRFGQHATLSKSGQYSALTKAVLTNAAINCSEYQLPKKLEDRFEFFEKWQSQPINSAVRDTSLPEYEESSISSETTEKTTNLLRPQTQKAFTNHPMKSTALIRPTPRHTCTFEREKIAFFSPTPEETLEAAIHKGQQKALNDSCQENEQNTSMNDREIYDLNLYFLSRPVGKDAFPTAYYMKP